MLKVVELLLPNVAEKMKYCTNIMFLDIVYRPDFI
jgi:hypothetical protein